MRLCTSDILGELEHIPRRDCKCVPGGGKSLIKFYHEEELPVVSVGPCGKIVEYVSPDEE
jgi:hypothetical protein